MELTWFGHACFRFRGREATVITDPPDPALGYAIPRLPVNVLTCSHQHPGHGYLDMCSDGCKALTGPGEYEIAGVFITGVHTYHDDVKGVERGRNVVFAVTVDDVTVAHLGDLGHQLTAEQRAELPTIDVLLVPVGGVTTINGAQAAELVTQLQPHVVIPMHYRTAAEHTQPLETVERFLREIGQKEVAPQNRVNVTKSNLPDQLQVIVLEAQGLKGDGR
ncbi:MAG: MBL fold metallo-hydrolase [Chloroflexi bacterium]|nr:MBL fold metallo-hydrolase [Chloroflexota bacterium]